jgi:hypothetical protein
MIFPPRNESFLIHFLKFVVIVAAEEFLKLLHCLLIEVQGACLPLEKLLARHATWKPTWLALLVDVGARMLTLNINLLSKKE